MVGICPKCSNRQMVHRGSWIVRIPKCRKCGAPLNKDENARRTVRKRMIQAIKK